jgi:hypothetical protein
MPGVNEWLTIRSLRPDSFKQLLMGRCDVCHGSGMPQTGPAMVRRARDNIGLIMLLKTL